MLRKQSREAPCACAEINNACAGPRYTPRSEAIE
jgi:hypothetical protein